MTKSMLSGGKSKTHWSIGTHKAFLNRLSNLIKWRKLLGRTQCPIQARASTCMVSPWRPSRRTQPTTGRAPCTRDPREWCYNITPPLHRTWTAPSCFKIKMVTNWIVPRTFSKRSIHWITYNTAWSMTCRCPPGKRELRTSSRSYSRTSRKYSLSKRSSWTKMTKLKFKT